MKVEKIEAALTKARWEQRQHGHDWDVADAVPVVKQLVIDELERAASGLQDLALALIATQDDEHGTALAAAIVSKCADIVRHQKIEGT